ncbi:MAG: DUF1501 domain-containing protein, partial [Pirellula sp.]
MLTILGSHGSTRNVHSRRRILQAGSGGLFGIGLHEILKLESLADTGQTPSAKCKSVIFLFLFGGPSQLETFDKKPDAPEKIR